MLLQVLVPATGQVHVRKRVQPSLRCELVSSANPLARDRTMSFFGIGVFKHFWSVQRYYAVLYYVRKDVLCWSVNFVILLDLHHHRAVSVLSLLTKISPMYSTEI